MRKILMTLLTFALLAMSSLAAAAPQAPRGEREYPTIAVMFENNLGSSVDQEVTERLQAALATKINEQYFLLVPGEEYLTRLKAQGITRVAEADRSRLTEEFTAENIDYYLYLQVSPLEKAGRKALVNVSFGSVEALNNTGLYARRYLQKSIMDSSENQEAAILEAVDIIAANIVAKLEERQTTFIPLTPLEMIGMGMFDLRGRKCCQHGKGQMKM